MFTCIWDINVVLHLAHPVMTDVVLYMTQVFRKCWCLHYSPSSKDHAHCTFNHQTLSAHISSSKYSSSCSNRWHPPCADLLVSSGCQQSAFGWPPPLSLYVFAVWPRLQIQNHYIHLSRWGRSEYHPGPLLKCSTVCVLIFMLYSCSCVFANM